MVNGGVGLGFDVHRFTDKRKDLILGGVRIEYSQGLEAVSDGDVVLHAVCDGILGAACLGDIGDYFPPQEERFKGIESRKIVEFVLEKISKGFKIISMDVTIIAEKPPLVKYKSLIVNSLRRIFKVERVNLKIKSKENSKILGASDCVACWALVCLEKC